MIEVFFMKKDFFAQSKNCISWQGSKRKSIFSEIVASTKYVSSDPGVAPSGLRLLAVTDCMLEVLRKE